MRYSTILGASVFAFVAIVTAPTHVRSQTATEKVEQKAEQAWKKTKDVTQDVKTGISDSWLTAKTKIALFADERVKGNQVSVETLSGRSRSAARLIRTRRRPRPHLSRRGSTVSRA